MLSVEDADRLYTVGQIAQEHGVPVTRVVYVVCSRSVRSVGKAGKIRLLDDRAVAVIRRELDRIAAKREAAPCR